MESSKRESTRLEERQSMQSKIRNGSVIQDVGQVELWFLPRRVQAAAGEQPHTHTLGVSVWNDDWGEHGESCIPCHFGEFVSSGIAAHWVWAEASLCPFYYRKKNHVVDHSFSLWVCIV